MDVVIRQETSADYEAVFNLIKNAFRTAEHSDQREHLLVEKLRKSPAFVPELSLVAEFENEIVGHILLTKIRIIGENGSVPSLALAPVSVLPTFQRRGIGGKLIERAHRKAAELKYESVILLGEPDYYRKFGYKPAENYDVSLPFDGVEEYSMAIELVENGLKNAGGTVEYAKDFYGGEN